MKVTPITTPLKSVRISEIVQDWYASFVDVDQTLLFELVTAANFMDIKALLDLTCLAVSVLIKVSVSSKVGGGGAFFANGDLYIIRASHEFARDCTFCNIY
jgi:hypothetical protein